MTLCLRCGSTSNCSIVQCDICNIKVCIQCSINGHCKDCYVNVEQKHELEEYYKEKYQVKT